MKVLGWLLRLWSCAFSILLGLFLTALSLLVVATSHNGDHRDIVRVIRCAQSCGSFHHVLRFHRLRALCRAVR